MTGNLYNKLFGEGLISEASLAKIQAKEKEPALFSIHWEVKAILYIGVLMLTGGLGLLIYKNIDSIGHQVVLLLIALISLGCFAYCISKRQPFNRSKVKAPTPVFDYLLLLGSITMLIFVGYLQYQYSVFGTNYGLATFIPMVALFFIAYYFDHLGILSMAIANLALWMGVSVTPKALLLNKDWDNQTIIYTYLVLGTILISSALFTQRYNFKGHFKFSYQHYGIHVTYIALLAGYFHFYDTALAVAFILGIVLLSVRMYLDAFKNGSFYMLLLVVLYSYITLSSLVVRALIAVPEGGGIWLLFMYFISSGIGLIFLLIHLNKKVKSI